jgi:hypothetical protein
MILKKYDSKSIIAENTYRIISYHIIPDLILLLKVPTASTVFPTTLVGLLLEVPTALAASIVPDPAARVVSSVEAAAASIQHLEEVPTALTTLSMAVPTTVTT